MYERFIAQKETSRYFLAERWGFTALRHKLLIPIWRRDGDLPLCGINFSSPSGGEMGIRTPGDISATHAFQACAFNHSAISPRSFCAGEFIAKSATCSYVNFMALFFCYLIKGLMEDLVQFVYFLFALLVTMSVHESAHGF